jgi:(5-formylfuran-3-yl)methyl phosphate synthase
VLNDGPPADRVINVIALGLISGVLRSYKTPSELPELASLLVSVRSAAEARAAVAGGASIIDVKEPSRGSLGRSDASVWQAVRMAVPRSMPLSVALGELNEWLGSTRPQIPANAWDGIDFCKLGLAGAPTGWSKLWTDRGGELRLNTTPFPDWVAVVYLDWEAAGAPHPDAIIDAAAEMPECRAVLFDTWRKISGARLDQSWKPRVERVRGAGRLVALAGSLDAAAIARLRVWQPDIFAVRGAACAEGDRLGSIDAFRVACLAEAVACGLKTAASIRCAPAQMSKRTP